MTYQLETTPHEQSLRPVQPRSELDCAAHAIELHGLSKRYGAVQALSGVSRTLRAGRFLVLLGPSGSGKSTLIRCLAGIERPSDGTIALAGKTVADERLHIPPERRDLAMVFQDFALWPHMTVAENVRFALRRRRLRGSEARRRVLSMLDRVGLAALSERYPHELSGGEQQRAALARALVAQPRLLLFDEPLSSLDASLRERLRIEISTLVRESGASAVYITHDQSEAFALGDEVGVLERGRLVQCDTPELVYQQPASAFVARFTGLAGELHGRMLAPVVPSGADGFVRVLLEPHDTERAPELVACAPAPLAVGQAVQILVRPAAVQIRAVDDTGAHLRGTMLDSAFRGRGYDHAVRLPDGSVLTEIFARERYRRDEAVGLRLDPGGCMAFPLDSAVELPVPAGLPAGPNSSMRDAGPTTDFSQPNDQQEERSMNIHYAGEQA